MMYNELEAKQMTSAGAWPHSPSSRHEPHSVPLAPAASRALRNLFVIAQTNCPITAKQRFALRSIVRPVHPILTINALFALADMLAFLMIIASAHAATLAPVLAVSFPFNAARDANAD